MAHTSYISVDTLQECIGPFEKGILLGEGGYGEVYELCSKSDNCGQFVVKIFDMPGYEDDDDFIKDPIPAAVQEYEIGRRAWECDPSIVLEPILLCINKSEDEAAITYPRIDGILNDKLEISGKQVISLYHKLEILHQICGILHGDLHLRNIFVKGDDIILGDLGEAKLNSSQKLFDTEIHSIIYSLYHSYKVPIPLSIYKKYGWSGPIYFDKTVKIDISPDEQIIKSTYHKIKQW